MSNLKYLNEECKQLTSGRVFDQSQPSKSHGGQEDVSDEQGENKNDDHFADQTLSQFRQDGVDGKGRDEEQARDGAADWVEIAGDASLEFKNVILSK